MQWHVGPFRLDRDNACLWRGDERLILRPKTFDLLVYLVEHAGELVTKDELLTAVWPETVVADSVLTVSISELRKVLGETARNPQFITTVHRRGYCFIAPVVAEGASPTRSAPLAMQEPIARRLAVIFSADAQGYSRLMEHDDVATVHTLTTYRELMTACIEQHHGRVVDAPGDNLLAEFASVLDAVQGAVVIQQELAQRNHALPVHRQMWFRIGINLGDVLVNGERLYGDGVNIAARLEGLAEGGGICLSGTVYDQIETKLDLAYTALGEQVVKNMTKPIRAYRVALRSVSDRSPEPQESSLAWESAASPPIRPTPHLVSREAELALLHACWARALQGERQVVFISGEAGIGKTTLVDAFVAQVAPPPSAWVGHGQCIEQYGAGEPYLPLLDAFGQLCRGPGGAHLIDRLMQHAPSWLMQMPALLSTAAYDTLHRHGAGATRERMLRELAEAVETLSAERPLVLVLEDLHWSDTSTLEWLAYVARRRPPARMLVLGTYRPVDAIVREHPVGGVTQELLVRGQCHQVVVDYLSTSQVEAYLTLRLGPGSLSTTLAPHLYQRTNGNALFLVTMVDEIVRQGLLRERITGWELAEDADVMTMAAPKSLQHLIIQQLEQLTGDEQTLLEAASVVGKVFTVAPVAAALERPVEDVEERCAALSRRGQWVRAHEPETWPAGTVTAQFAFHHDLYRETAYERLPISRRIRWHQQIGTCLEAGYGSRAQEIAAELAVHFDRGQEVGQAVEYRRLAGENSLQRGAHDEATAHLRRGLELLDAWPASRERSQSELALLIPLGVSLQNTQGYAAPEVEHVFARAWELAQHVGEVSQRFRAMEGLESVYILRAESQKALELGEQLLHLAQRHEDASLLVVAHRELGVVRFHLGQLQAARAHVSQVRSLYESRHHHPHVFLDHRDSAMVSLCIDAFVLWLQGYPNQAVHKHREAVRLAQDTSHAFSLVFALTYLVRGHLLRREAALALEQAQVTIALATDYGFELFWGFATILHGWALAQDGEPQEALLRLRQGLTTVDRTGALRYRSHHLAMLAEVYGNVGQSEEGFVVLSDARAHVDTTEERYWESELYRLQGELQLQQNADPVSQPETCFLKALDIARSQQAKSLELRAATSLARLWQSQGKRQDAYDLLAPVYNWFTEGFDTADLQEAQHILDELSAEIMALWCFPGFQISVLSIGYKNA